MMAQLPDAAPAAPQHGAFDIAAAGDVWEDRTDGADPLGPLKQVLRRTMRQNEQTAADLHSAQPVDGHGHGGSSATGMNGQWSQEPQEPPQCINLRSSSWSRSPSPEGRG